MTEPTTVRGAHFNKKALFVSLGMTIVFDIGLAIVAFQMARALGASETVAYLVAIIGPLVGMLAYWMYARRLGGVSIIILVVLLVSSAVSLVGSPDPHILLLKDSFLTGGFGVVTLLSALPVFPKPLMFYFGLKFGTDGTRGGIQAWYDLWDRYRSFRHGQYVINTVWGVAFIIEASIKAACSLTLPFDIAYTVNQIFPFAVLAAVIVWTTMYGKKQAEAGAARAAAERSAADASQPAPPAESAP